MTSRQLVWLVARRELADRLGRRAFLATTALSALVIVGLVVGPSLFDGDPEPLQLGVTSNADLPADFDSAAQATVAAFDIPAVAVTTLPDRAAARAALEDEAVDAVVLSRTELLVSEAGTEHARFVAQAIQAATLNEFLTEQQVDATQLQAALAPPDLQLVTPDGTDEAQRNAQFGMGMALTVLLFLTLQINGASILTTTVEEKSSRVVEVLLGVLRPWQLLAGKLIAMTAISIGQLLLYAGSGLAAATFTSGITLPPATTSTIVAGIAMFVVGFGLYAAIYAVAGSLAGSAEEAQAAAAPIGFVSAAVYMAVIVSVIPNPNGILSQVLTWVPLSAPFAVPARMTSGFAPWQAGLAFLVTAVAMVVVVRLAGRLYSAAVLSGGKMSWRAAFRAEPIR